MATTIKCACGRKVECRGFTTTCECGADYNWNGDLLAPREQWGEETGEHPADIARIDTMSTDDLLEGD
jgi:hypothetical protein